MKIALTYTGSPEKHQYYADWLQAKENIDVVRLSAEDNNLNELNSCDALVLSGGVDIHPRFYGGMTGYSGAPEKFNEKRDEFEINAFTSAQQKNIPVLGICRGLQLINIIQKGTLIQDLPDESVAKAHKGNPDKYHTVHIEAGTWLNELTGTTHGEITSAHHQAIDKPGEGLLINARAEDGTIEGIEWKDKSNKPPMLAVQWHPERMFGCRDSALCTTIRDQFISAVKKFNAAKYEDH